MVELMTERLADLVSARLSAYWKEKATKPGGLSLSRSEEHNCAFLRKRSS